MPNQPNPSKRKRGARPLRVSPQDGVARGIALHQQGDAEAAAKIYRQVLAACPDHVDALHFLGVAEHQLGHSEAALKLIARSIERDPDHPDAHNNLGNVYKQLGRLEEAEAAYRRVLELRPDDANELSNLGTVRREQGDLEGAVAIFRQTLEIQPDHVQAWQNLGNALSGLQRFEEALDAHKEAMRLSPKSADSHRHLGAMFYAVGRVQDAVDIYRQWLALYPYDPQARHMLSASTGEQVPERASDDFVRSLFDNFALSFDRSLARLQYRAPALVADAVAEVFGGAQATLRILDAGCGTGLCGPLLRPLAAELTGVDLSERMADCARQRSVYDAVVVGELTAFLQRHPGDYDLIVSADTLVYFGVLAEVVAAAHQALLSGGALVFTVERSEPSDAPGGYRIFPHGRYGHTRDYLHAVLSAAGFCATAAREVTLRKEAGKWVDGWLVTARVPDAPSSSCTTAHDANSRSQVGTRLRE
jgi:predicted TPR repeat methyltransferase